MLIHLLLKFRKFNKFSERKDSGYFSGLDNKNKAVIDINNEDAFEEQILTFFHELTHCAIDILFRYKRKEKKRN